LSFKFWLAGISLSLASTIASLSKLRADGRRFALSNQIAKKESQSEKTPEDRTRAEVERREKGRALLL
jgi:peroxin-11B